MSHPLQPVYVVLLASALAASAALAEEPASSSTAPAVPAHPQAAAALSVSPAAAAPASAALDLGAPPVEHVLPPAQLRALLSEEELAVDDDVRVESPRYGVDVPLGQLRAVPWAILHPTQAWRVFIPVVEP